LDSDKKLDIYNFQTPLNHHFVLKLHIASNYIWSTDQSYSNAASKTKAFSILMSKAISTSSFFS